MAIPYEYGHPDNKDHVLARRGHGPCLEKMARRWGVSKSEALRRVIRAAAAQAGTEEGGPLQLLDQLQSSAALSAKKAGDWIRHSRTARRVASSRGESTST
jgi:hypothetical protein